VDADLPVYNVRTVASFARWSARSWLILLQMIAVMGILGLILAVVGLYGLISYSVSRRTAEIGVRMAIGASRADVLRLVLRQGLILGVAGIAAGGALTAVAAPVLAAGLAGLGTLTSVTFVVVPIALLAVSAVASYLPARRAARLDPVHALRWE
jgi:ABC-type antimicrobial peptide transport system permease subunit